jgi:hypothetical protein
MCAAHSPSLSRAPLPINLAFPSPPAVRVAGDVVFGGKALSLSKDSISFTHELALTSSSWCSRQIDVVSRQRRRDATMSAAEHR